MKKLILIFLGVMFSLVTFGQKATISVRYTATLDSLNVQTDSIKITNYNQGNDTILYGSDTVLILDYTTGLYDNQREFRNSILSQNYPNPFKSRTVFNVSIHEYGEMSVYVYDISGKEIASLSDHYLSGVHTFSFMTGKGGYYILSVTFNNSTYSIKMFCLSENTNRRYEIDYLGGESLIPGIKSSNSKGGFSFTPGDQLSSVGYYQSITDTSVFIPKQDTIIEFSFQAIVQCPSSLIDTRDNQVYTTVLIGSQCWMAENLNIGLKIEGSVDQTDNGTIEKYCYGNDTVNCDIYGGLYQWDEMMQYDTSGGVHGICPAGWHIPTDDEWKILEGSVDSLYGVGDPEWDGMWWRGLDAGGNLKETGSTHWNTPNVGATNSSGFTALPGGDRGSGGSFFSMGLYGYFWSSSEFSNQEAWYRYLYYIKTEVHRQYFDKSEGFSVRCLKDN